MASTRLDNRLLEPLYAAIEWWLAELRDLARQALPFGQSKPLRLQVASNDELTPVDPDTDRIGGGRRNVLLQLDDNFFLYRKIKLPQAVGKNIERVVGYEFNKYFPMSIEDALFSCRVAAVQPNANSIEVEIWAIGRHQIDLYLAMIRRQFELDVRRLLIADSSGRTLITRNLEQEQRAQADPRQVLLGRVLNLVLAGLAAALIAYPVIRMDAYLEDQRAEIDRLERKASPIMQTREKSTALDKRFHELIERKTAYPARADIWSYLTRTVGEQAVIERISISGRRVQLSGRAPSVERLLRNLEAEGRISDVRIVGQVKPSKESGFEVLNLDLELWD